ncbi:MAG: DUF2892 domain-containing protein [Chitinophagaceae bacterium]|jgi:hypothetical protein|nr:DUF2892 domain-containing protein [Chitinophagaceae bacterium]
MKKNIGNIDKVVRIALAIVIAILYFTHNIAGNTTALILGIVAVILVATSFINFCPLYKILGISTTKKSSSK